mmetsp:Transcript_144670/g.463542  ORF Transcript_144670/g.463542 Transcript_144670/m.463542 type:complete len:238 (-) Transcript_144670:441-1154(-)
MSSGTAFLTSAARQARSHLSEESPRPTESPMVAMNFCCNSIIRAMSSSSSPSSSFRQSSAVAWRNIPPSIFRHFNDSKQSWLRPPWVCNQPMTPSCSSNPSSLSSSSPFPLAAATEGGTAAAPTAAFGTASMEMTAPKRRAAATASCPNSFRIAARSPCATFAAASVVASSKPARADTSLSQGVRWSLNPDPPAEVMISSGRPPPSKPSVFPEGSSRNVRPGCSTQSKYCLTMYGTP